MSKEDIQLSQLNLQNFATFERQSIEFGDGLNIIIGETGSGKSLIFDALQIVLGQRADKNLVRTNTEFSTIEATFYAVGEHVHEFLHEIGYPGDGNEIVLKRIVYANGKTKSFINFQQCNLKTLQSFSSRYIDLVGQFENQKLLSSKYQLKLLDHYSGNTNLLTNYENQFIDYSDLKNKKQELEEKKSSRDQRLDYLNFQINEIEEVNPEVGEETGLIQRKDSLMNVKEHEKVLENLKYLYFEGDNALSPLMAKIKKLLLENMEIIPNEALKNFEQAQALLDDFSYQISDINLEESEEDLESIIDRLDKFQKLKRKFSGSIEDVIHLLESFQIERQELDNIATNLDEIDGKIELVLNKMSEFATKLSQKRKTNAKKLSTELSKAIQSLNMKGAQIKVDFSKLKEFGKYGNDKIAIMAETNPGEGFFPIEKIASGGELSRILLSIRQILVGDSISIFLFDEVDTGIGGETALLIGKSLKKVSSKSQVIAISHLPQIAINADQIIKVEKSTVKVKKDIRTLSNIQILTKSSEIKKETELMTPLS